MALQNAVLALRPFLNRIFYGTIVSWRFDLPKVIYPPDIDLYQFMSILIISLNQYRQN